MRISAIILIFFPLRIFCQDVLQIDTATIASGLKIYLLRYETKLPLHVKLIIDAGKKSENKCEVGYSEFITKLLNQSINESRSEELKDVKFESENGQTVFSANCNDDDAGKLLDLLCYIIARQKFLKEKMDQVLALIIDAYKTENMSMAALSELYGKFLFYGKENPLGRNYCQYQAEKVLPAELREFYQSHYLPQRSSLMICGNFDPHEMKKTVAKLFVKWKSNRQPEEKVEHSAPNRGKPENEIAFVNRMDSDHYHLKWINPAPEFNSADRMAFELTSEILKKALAAEAFHLKGINLSGDLIEVSCSSDKNHLKASIRFFDSTIKVLQRTTFTNSDLENVINIRKRDILSNRDPEALLDFYDPLKYDFKARQNYLNDLSQIKAIDIQRILKSYFSENASQLIITGKVHLVEKELSSFKNMKHYQAADFETCDESCREVVVIRCHCESCWKRGQYKVWRFNPSQKEAIKCARAKSGLK